MFRCKKGWHARAVAALVTAALMGGIGASSARAEPDRTATAGTATDQKILDSSDAVVAAAGAASTTPVKRTDEELTVQLATSMLKIPQESTEPISVADVKIGLPNLGGEDASVAPDGTVVYRNENASAETAVQATVDGVRALVVLKDASAPREYRFPVSLPPGGRLITAAELLGEEYDTGEIVAVDSEGAVLGLFGAAWAKDANGARVRTDYRVEGSTIVQSVNINAESQFPVVADPEWVQVAKCVGVITLAIGATIVPGGAIVRFISKVGSIKKAATIFVRALNAAKPGKKEAALKSLLLSVGGSLTGVGVIASECSF